jgi:hypothetical protein
MHHYFCHTKLCILTTHCVCTFSIHTPIISLNSTDRLVSAMIDGVLREAETAVLRYLDETYLLDRENTFLFIPYISSHSYRKLGGGGLLFKISALRMKVLAQNLLSNLASILTQSRHNFPNSTVWFPSCSTTKRHVSIRFYFVRLY